MLKLRSLAKFCLFALLLSGCAELWFQDTEFDPFVAAIQECDLASVEQHVSDGRSPLEREDGTDSSMLAFALAARPSDGETQRCTEVVEYFLDAGADPVDLGGRNSGAPITVIRGDLSPEILDLFDPTAENWCNIGRRTLFNSVVAFAEDDDDWDSESIEVYLSDCS